MGWASYLEDIVEKLNSDLDLVKSSTSYEMDRAAQLKVLIRVCERFLVGIQQHMELATDPALNLANEIIKLREANEALNRRIRILEDSNGRHKELVVKHAELQKRFDEVNGRSAKRFAEIKELEKKYERLEKEYARSGRRRG